MGTSFSTLDDYYKLLEIAAANPPPVQAHTCEYCADIIIEIPELKGCSEDRSRRSLDCIFKNVSRSLIVKGQDSACPVLELFDRNRDPSTQALRIYSNSNPQRTMHFSIPHDPHKGFKNSGRIQGPVPPPGHFGSLFHDNDYNGLNPDWEILRFPWNTSAITTESFDFLRNALNHCSTSHTRCKRTTGLFVPRRLIEIPKSGTSVSTRVVETEELGIVQWCALSYCWGGPQKERAIQSDFKNSRREKRVMLRSLPRTILDAIVVARGLHIPYIWVDSFCILQDDPEDLANELSKIPRIYGDAVLTISAAKAITSGEGFLAPRASRSLQDVLPAHLQFKALNRSAVSLLFCLKGSIRQEAIDQRAWTLQESFLSTREIRFENDKISWSCLNEFKHYGGVGKDEFSLVQYRRIILSSPLDYKIRIFLLSNFWNRKLTFHGDKLLAFSAIEAVLPRHPDDRYLAGIWSYDLPRALFWAVVRCSGNRRPLEYRAPSWSWAGIDTTHSYQTHPDISIQYYDEYPSYRKLQILDAFSEPSDLRLPFGNARRAHLILRAPSLRLTLRKPRSSCENAGVYLVQTENDRSIIYRYNTPIYWDQLRLDAPEDDFESWQEDRGWEVYVPLALCKSSIWHCFLLLRLLCSKEGKYQRVGVLLMESLWTELFANASPDLEDQLFTVV